jgi:hypothetical protein
LLLLARALLSALSGGADAMKCTARVIEMLKAAEAARDMRARAMFESAMLLSGALLRVAER